MAKKDKKTTISKACPECGKAMTYETRDDQVEYQGHTKTFPNTAWWCPCGESIQDGAALQTAERAFVELRAEVDKVLLPEEVAEVRSKLKLSQRKAGEILGGGPRAFQKYESGQTPVSTAMKHLLVLLGNDPTRLAELAKLTSEGAASKVVLVRKTAPRRKEPSRVKIKLRGGKKRTGRAEQSSHA